MIRKFRKRFQLHSFIGLQLLMLIGLIWFGISYHKEFEENLTGKYRQQLSNTAATARLSVLSYFEKFSQNLVYLSHQPEVINAARKGFPVEDSGVYCPLEHLFQIHKGEIDALILMDTSAMVIKRIANDTMDLHRMMCIGNPLANPHVPPDSTYYSDIIINHKNQKAITLSCPVYDGSVRIGILRWMITIESINNHFLQNIDRDKQIHFAITDIGGRLLSNTENYLDWLCQNMCKCEELKIHGSVVQGYNELSANGSGKLSMNPPGCDVYAAWSSFSVGDKSWKLMVMMPARTLDHALWNHGVITYGLTFLVLLIMLSITIIYYTTRLKQSKLETEKQYLGQLAESHRLLNEERANRLSYQIIGQEQERRRISMELHDGLGQLLLSMRLRLKQAQEEHNCRSQNCNDEIEGMLNNTISEIRRISNGLSPVMLLELGIVKALDRYCAEMASHSGIRIDYVSYGIQDTLPTEISTHLFRIVQEALTNAIRHSEPVEINIQLLGSREKITLMVQDDGKGFNYTAGRPGTGHGIDHMRDRVSILNGTFEMQSQPGSGTVIIIKIPLDYGRDEH
jgi:signal transduction histidine kinase